MEPSGFFAWDNILNDVLEKMKLRNIRAYVRSLIGPHAFLSCAGFEARSAQGACQLALCTYPRTSVQT